MSRSVIVEPTAVPWTPFAAMRLVLTNLMALAGLGLAWYEASEKVVVRDQFPWVNVAILAVIVSGVTNGTWFLLGRMALRRRRQRVLPATAQASEPFFGAPLEPAAPVWVAATGTTRYHRPSCLLVTGRATVTASRAVHEREGRRPCGVCVDGEG